MLEPKRCHHNLLVLHVGEFDAGRNVHATDKSECHVYSVRCVSCNRPGIRTDQHGFLERHNRRGMFGMFAEAKPGICAGSGRHISFNTPVDGEVK